MVVQSFRGSTAWNFQTNRLFYGQPYTAGISGGGLIHFGYFLVYMIKEFAKSIKKAYEHIQLRKSAGAPYTYTRAEREKRVGDNTKRNGGTPKCDNCGRKVKKAKQHVKGKTPSSNEMVVSNNQVLCWKCFLDKRKNPPT